MLQTAGNGNRQNAEIGKTAAGMESFGETLHPFLMEVPE
jgi:hypothetical protein